MVLDCAAGLCCFPFCCFPCAWFYPCLVKGGAAGGAAGAAAGGCCCVPGAEHAAASCCAAEHACCVCLTETFCAPCLRIPCLAPCFAAERACCGAVAGAAAIAPSGCQQNRSTAVVNKYMPLDDEEDMTYEMKFDQYYGEEERVKID